MSPSALSPGAPLGRLARLPLRLLPASTVVPVLQGRLRGAKWVAGSSVHGCWLGTFEHAKRRLFESAVAPGGVVYDVGANVGYYTLLASRLVGPTGRVFAFEPVPRNLRCLERHLALNGVINVAVVGAAVSDRSGWASFVEGPSNAMGHLGAEGRLRVKTITLDGLVAAGEAASPDVVKIDVEGAEAQVLAGGRSLLAQSRPTVFVATHNRAAHRDCCALLRELGYQLSSVSGASVEDSDEILARAR